MDTLRLLRLRRAIYGAAETGKVSKQVVEIGPFDPVRRHQRFLFVHNFLHTVFANGLEAFVGQAELQSECVFVCADAGVAFAVGSDGRDTLHFIRNICRRIQYRFLQIVVRTRRAHSGQIGSERAAILTDLVTSGTASRFVDLPAGNLVAFRDWRRIPAFPQRLNELNERGQLISLERECRHRTAGHTLLDYGFDIRVAFAVIQRSMQVRSTAAQAGRPMAERAVAAKQRLALGHTALHGLAIYDCGHNKSEADEESHGECALL